MHSNSRRWDSSHFKNHPLTKIPEVTNNPEEMTFSGLAQC